jgi:hypothetical protein
VRADVPPQSVPSTTLLLEGVTLSAVSATCYEATFLLDSLAPGAYEVGCAADPG